MALVRERTTPTERPPPVSEVSATRHIMIYCHELNMAFDWASQALHCSTCLQLFATAWFAASHSLLQYIFSLQITTCLKVQGKQLIVFYSTVKEYGIKERVGRFTQWM